MPSDCRRSANSLVAVATAPGSLQMDMVFFSGQTHGWVNGISFYNGTLPTPPLYVMFVGLAQLALPQHETIILVRLLQCLAGGGDHLAGRQASA